MTKNGNNNKKNPSISENGVDDVPTPSLTWTKAKSDTFFFFSVPTENAPHQCKT